MDVKNKKRMLLYMIKNKGLCKLQGDNICTICILGKENLCNARVDITYERCTVAARSLITEQDLFNYLI